VEPASDPAPRNAWPNDRGGCLPTVMRLGRDLIAKNTPAGLTLTGEPSSRSGGGVEGIIPQDAHPIVIQLGQAGVGLCSELRSAR